MRHKISCDAIIRVIKQYFHKYYFRCFSAPFKLLKQICQFDLGKLTELFSGSTNSYTWLKPHKLNINFVKAKRIFCKSQKITNRKDFRKELSSSGLGTKGDSCKFGLYHNIYDAEHNAVKKNNTGWAYL